MEVVTILLLGGLLGAVLAIGALILMRSKRKTEPEVVAPPAVAETSATESVLARTASALESDSAEGTTKIDREAIRSIVGGESSVVEEAYFLVIAGEGLGRFIKLDRDEYIIGRDPVLADICFIDDTISKRHARVHIVDGFVEIEDLGSSNGTFVDGKEVRRARLDDGSRVVLGRSTVLTLTFQDELGEKFQQQMYESSTRDRLTGAYNKATFWDHLDSEMHYARRHGTNYCLVMLDIDHFKPINDTHGHLVGDEILAEVAEVIRRVIRNESLFVRYGGEEFIVSERNADLEIGQKIAERIRRTVAEHEFATSAGPLRVTISLGVADLKCIADPDGTALIEAADAALYRAKEEGRNSVCIASRQRP